MANDHRPQPLLPERRAYPEVFRLAEHPERKQLLPAAKVSDQHKTLEAAANR